MEDRITQIVLKYFELIILNSSTPIYQVVWVIEFVPQGPQFTHIPGLWKNYPVRNALM